MKKKISLVVGGSKGIGLSIYNILKKRGDRVFIISRNSKVKKDNIKVDLTDNLNLKSKIEKNFKNLNVDNIIFSQRYRGLQEAESFKTDLFSTTYLLSILKNKINKNGSIVFISSVSNRTILDDQSVNYHIIRSGIEQMMRYYTVKFSNKEIRFNCVLPSKIIKISNRKFFFKEKKGIKIKKLIEKITPLKRMGTSEDVAKMIKFLTSEDSEYITGQSFIIDGGLSLLSQESIVNLLKKNKNLL